MDRFHELGVFVGIADAGSFAEAGRRLRLSPPAVTRAVAALEDRLGVRLFNRTTRSLKLTEAGVRFLDSARRILAELETAEREATGETATPAGHLGVTASLTFGRLVLAPVVASFLTAHPRVTASLLLVDRVVNLVEEGMDVAVRIGRLPDSALVARKVGEVRRILVASPDYIGRRGMPQSPAELKLHSVVAFTGIQSSHEWPVGSGPQPTMVTVRSRLDINDATAALAVATAGHGITVALSYMVAEELRRGTLVEVLADAAPPPVPVHIVYPQTRLLAPKVRAFLDFTAPRLRDMLEGARIDA